MKQYEESVMSCQKTNNVRGFTLVELLVVIGIIAVLISLLLPSLSKAQKAAKSVACMSNLRSLAQAVAIYQAENRQYYPPLSQYANVSFTSNNFKGYNLWGLLKITPGNMIAVCPEVLTDLQLPSIVGSPRSYYSYKYNWMISGSETNPIVAPWAPHAQPVPNTTFVVGTPMKNIPASSETMMFMDYPQLICFQTDDQPGTDRGMQWAAVNQQGTGQLVITATGQQHQVFRQVAPVHGAVHPTPNALGKIGAIYAAMQGSINIAYCDGSVRSVIISQGLYDTVADPNPQVNLTDATTGGVIQVGSHCPIDGTRYDPTFPP
jgi:prepilin-type N-terminal cleavage/methylation domain-containing protein/prepilin-type processing-associated H-X9-DG protein